MSARLAPAVLLLLGFVVVGLAATGATGGTSGDVRAVLTPLWLVLGPGWALATALRPGSPAALAVLSVACGLALSIVIGQVMVVSGAWHPVGVLGVLAALVQPVLVVQALRRSPA